METVTVIDGRYELLGDPKPGGQANVYRAWDLRDNRDVAVKVPKQAVGAADRREFADRLEREREALSRVAHRNVVSLLDAGTSVFPGSDETYPYIVMDFVTGQTLEERMVGRSGFEVDSVVLVMEQLLDALQALHDAIPGAGLDGRHAIHRDVNPSNVMVDDSWKVTLIDFGIVKTFDSSPSTGSHRVVGTYGYMSPEQLVADRSVDGRADVYSAGCLMYWMLTGRKPFSSDNPVTLNREQQVAPPPPSRLSNRPDVAWFDGTVLRAIKYDPADRFKSVAAMKRQLVSSNKDRQPEVASVTVLNEEVASRTKQFDAVGAQEGLPDDSASAFAASVHGGVVDEAVGAARQSVGNPRVAFEAVISREVTRLTRSALIKGIGLGTALGLVAGLLLFLLTLTAVP